MSSVAIIGTRDPNVYQRMAATALASRLSRDHGITIATGGAYGIDQAAMNGAKPSLLEVYLPWASYNREVIPRDAGKIIIADPIRHRAWFESVDRYHPNPAALKHSVRALHARNYGIVIGRDLVIAFPHAEGSGGTGQGIRIAEAEGIPLWQFHQDSVIPPTDQLIQDVLVLLR